MNRTGSGLVLLLLLLRGDIAQDVTCTATISDLLCDSI
jgi:hypothetical protein